jgi:hypothetical protein
MINPNLNHPTHNIHYTNKPLVFGGNGRAAMGRCNVESSNLSSRRGLHHKAFTIFKGAPITREERRINCRINRRNKLMIAREGMVLNKSKFGRAWFGDDTQRARMETANEAFKAVLGEWACVTASRYFRVDIRHDEIGLVDS